MSTERTFPTSLEVTVTIRAAFPSTMQPVVVRGTVDGHALMTAAYDTPSSPSMDRGRLMRQSMIGFVRMAIDGTVREAAWRMLSGMLGLDPEEK